MAMSNQAPMRKEIFHLLAAFRLRILGTHFLQKLIWTYTIRRKDHVGPSIRQGFLPEQVGNTHMDIQGFLPSLSIVEIYFSIRGISLMFVRTSDD